MALRLLSNRVAITIISSRDYYLFVTRLDSNRKRIGMYPKKGIDVKSWQGCPHLSFPSGCIAGVATHFMLRKLGMHHEQQAGTRIRPIGQ